MMKIATMDTFFGILVIAWIVDIYSNQNFVMNQLIVLIVISFYIPKIVKIVLTALDFLIAEVATIVLAV